MVATKEAGTRADYRACDCGCGEMFPEKGTKRFASEKCKKRAYGRRLRNQAESDTGSGTSSDLVPLAARLKEFFEAEGLRPEDLGAVQSVKAWDALARGAEGEPTEKVSMLSVKVDPTWATGPKWPVVQHAKPISVRVPKAPKAMASVFDRVALIEPDPQIGFVRTTGGRLIPIHDPQALDISEQIGQLVRPDVWVNLGDYLDLANMSSFRQEPAFAMTVQPAVEEGYRHAAVMSAVADQSWVHEGNHDQRIANYILDHAQAAFGLKKANTPESWPVMSVPSLCRFDELGVEFVDGYPATWKHLNENLSTTHGTWTSSKSTPAAQNVLRDQTGSVIFGHDHTRQTLYQTTNTQNGMKQIVSHSPGCLCRIDGTVPGGGKYRGRKVDGSPVRSFQNWQHGITLVHYDDREFELEHVPIRDGVAVFRGQRLESRVDINHVHESVEDALD